MPMAGLWLDALTLFLLLAYGLSVLVALVPTGQAAAADRFARGLVLAPPLVALALVGLGFWPSLRAVLGGDDHCAGAIAGHPHLCWLHGAGGAGGMAHDAVALLVLALVAAVAAWHAFHWGQMLGRLRLLDSLAVPSREAEVRCLLEAAGASWPAGLTVVSFERPVCFVVGVRRPRLIMSTAVLDAMAPADLRAVVAHEAAHLARRDNVWRLAGHVALLFHLPWLGRRAWRRWSLTTEAACDDMAARAMGSRVEVAEALVRFQRLGQQRGAGPVLGVAFGRAGALETRVRWLLDPPPQAPWLTVARWWPWCLLLVAGWQADAVHEALEALLHALHV